MDAQENQIFVAIILAIIVVGSIISYFILSIIRHQKKLLHIERQNANAQVKALEQDRARIANDIHDDLSPMLVSVKMLISSFDLSHPADLGQFEKANNTLDDISKRMRAISFDLMPTVLKNKGLTAAVQEYINSVPAESGVHIKLKISNEEPTLTEEQTIHIYRIIKEIIHNTIKHANATELMLLIQEKDEHLQIVTRDNGVGFDYNSHIEANKGFGLRSLANRTTILNASIDVETRPGKGTAFFIKIPLNNV